MHEFHTSGDLEFLSPRDYRREQQTRHLFRTRQAVMRLLQGDAYGSKPVYVVRPARLFTRGALHATIPNQTATRWMPESQERRGWVLENVSNPPATSVTKDLGQLLLLDDLRAMVPSRFAEWGEIEDGLAVPATYLTPLTGHAPVRMERVSAELETLLADTSAL
ncbi:MAG TPA: hypothetical protein VLG11_06060 [Candidatus Saccharimonadales bacterium]|nr:hypothetical protein [Candidatus Saccharimonadales bacterium]